MGYSVKEIYYTLQGEGAHTGRAAVFCRFSGCNLWTGREKDRDAAICKFCDTDFVGTDGPGGGWFDSAEGLARAVAAAWIDSSFSASPFVVCTGGEPLLQLDSKLVAQFHYHGFKVAIETNGTMLSPSNIDWVCVSPKAGPNLVLNSGDELKLVFPQAGAEPHLFEQLEFKHFFLQPMDGPELDNNTRLAVEYCLEHLKWRLSLQTHKLIGIK
jgi:7-carboxy-7-deazaguanine synthase (Cx14CxxC type)